jgi:hypothetical protein
MLTVVTLRLHPPSLVQDVLIRDQHQLRVSDSLVPDFITPGELKSFLHTVLPQPTLFPLFTSHLPVGKFLELSQFITRLWKSKLTPSCLPSRLHVSMYCCTVRVVGTTILTILGPSLSYKNHFFFLYIHGRVRTGQNLPSVIRSGWYKCLKTNITVTT